jgi:hypothetical protein
MREPIALIVPGYMNTCYKYEDNAAEIVPESYSPQLFSPWDIPCALCCH